MVTSNILAPHESLCFRTSVWSPPIDESRMQFNSWVDGVGGTGEPFRFQLDAIGPRSLLVGKCNLIKTMTMALDDDGGVKVCMG